MINITRDGIKQKKGGYAFQYYRPGDVVYHFMNLVVGTNLQLQTIPSKKSSKAHYLFPYSEHEKLMEIVSIIIYLDGLLE